MGRALWMHAHRRACTSLQQLFDELSVSDRIAQAVREGWADNMGSPKEIMAYQSYDGTSKWLLRFEYLPGNQERANKMASPVEIETVFIPEDDQGVSGIDYMGRGTVCVSSQAGCSLGCTFCSTGRMALQRNLAPHEIVWQLLWVRKALGDLPPPPNAPNQEESPQLFPRSHGTVPLKAAQHAYRASNVVFMGQGEPLLNWRAVKRAASTMTTAGGCAVAPRKLTISTSGIAPAIPKVRTELGVSLALSLHAPTDELRSQLMPINRYHPLDHVMKAVKQYSVAQGPSDPAKPKVTSLSGSSGTAARRDDESPVAAPAKPGASDAGHGAKKQAKPRRVLIEYVMIRGVNDSPEHARQLGSLVQEHGLNAHVNLLPFNPFAGTDGDGDATIAGDDLSAEAESGMPARDSSDDASGSGGIIGDAADPSTYAPSPRESLLAFSYVLQGEPWRVSCNVRWPRGVDIDAACGQLRQKYGDQVKRAQSGTGQQAGGVGGDLLFQ